MFEIFPIVIFIGMFAVTGFIVSHVVKAWRGYLHNSIQPQQTAPARVVDKRTAFSASTSAHPHGAGGTRVRTYYFVTFEFQTGNVRNSQSTLIGMGSTQVEIAGRLPIRGIGCYGLPGRTRADGM